TITDWFDARASVLYSNSLTTKPFLYSSATYDPWYYLTRWPATYPYGTIDGLPFRNHIAEVQQAHMDEYTSSLTRVNLGGTIRPIEDLSIDFDYTFDENNSHDHQVGGTLSAYDFWGLGSNFAYVPYSSAAY